MPNSPSRERRRQQEWRECAPELAHLVDEVAPRIWEDPQSDRVGDIPDDWRALFDALAVTVRTKAEHPEFSAERPLGVRLGYEWCWAISHVKRYLGYMMRLIRADIGLKEGSETLASMALLNRGLELLHLELQHGGTCDGRDDAEENAVRVYRALRTLTPRFDDVSLRRLRALRIVESCAPGIRILEGGEVEASVERMRTHASGEGRAFDLEDEEAQRKWFRSELPVMKTLNARNMLAECDESFAKLDPLIVLEELAEASTGAKGGRADGGEAKTGPARALARLALRCGALEYTQAETETFDDAVDRVRRNLHTTRSRLRDELHSFPGLVPEDGVSAE